MKIIIVGNGKVGYAIASQLAQEHHDIVVVDDNTAALERAESTLDILCAQGNGASISVLMEAGVAGADLVIAVTDKDETNLVCCLIAKKLGAQHTIARVRNPEYRRDAAMLKKEIGLDMVINPDLAAAQEIARILSFPAAFSVEPFAQGRIDMIGVALTALDSIVGVSLGDFHRQRSADVLICAVQRGGEVLIPNGSFVPQAQDKLYLIGSKEELQKMLLRLGRKLQRVKSVSILGGSRISTYLSWELERTRTQVRIVERSEQKCRLLAQLLPHASILLGDGTDSELLEAEHLFDCDAFVALTDRDEENLLMALSAGKSGVGEVVAKMTRPNYMELAGGIHSIISPKDIVANQITRYVRALDNSRGSAVESLYKMLSGELEALEFIATESCGAVLDRPLRELKLRQNVLLGAIVRDNETIVPGGNTVLRSGDRVVVVSLAGRLNDLTDILAERGE